MAITRTVSATAAARSVSEADGDVDVGGVPALADRARAAAAPGERKPERRRGFRSPVYSLFSFSRCCRSRLSNCSRIWKKNTPRISMPTSTSSAMPSSTTIGMP